MTRALRPWSCALALLLVILLLAPVASAQLERSMADDADGGETLTVALRVTDATVGGKVVVSELLPIGATLLSWSVQGAQEQTSDLFIMRDDDALIWEFTAATESPSVTYVVRLAPDEDRAAFDAVYAAAPDAFGANKRSIAVTPIPPTTVPVVPEQPAPIPLPRGASAPVAGGLFLILVALMGAFLYVRTRSTQPHDPAARWFGHHAQRTVRSSFGSLRETLLAVFASASGEPVPVELTAQQERTILEFPQQQERLLGTLDKIEQTLPQGETEHHDLLARLKGEIAQIQFSVEN